MSGERIDELLEEALALGEIPADATAAERAELEGLLGPARGLHAATSALDQQAHATMPTARARFQRYVASHQAAARPAPRRASIGGSRAGLSGLFGMLFASSLVRGAAVVTVIGAIALFLSQSLTTNVDTASAQVLEPGSYVELQGIVTAAGAPHDGVVTVRLQAEFGEVEVDLNADGVVDDGGEARPVSSLRKGDGLVVAGQVGADRSVAANRLALAAASGIKKGNVKSLKVLPDNFEGTVKTVAISADGASGLALIEDQAGQRFLVPVTAETAATLLNQNASAVGSKVTLKTQDTKAGSGNALEVKGEANAAASHPLPPEVPAPPARPTPTQQRRPATPTPGRPATPAATPTQVPGAGVTPAPRPTQVVPTPRPATPTGIARQNTPGSAGTPGVLRTVTTVSRTQVPPSPRTITPVVKRHEAARTPTAR